MRRLVCHFLLVVSSASLLWPLFSMAQDQPAPQERTAKPQSKKELKEQEKRLSKELGSSGEIWLKEVVPYIITEEEREQFIEEFWRRRNPDPDSPNNVFKEEHYRRIAYANERFASGIPGWKSDRGHIYILWGPPDEIDSHPAGGAYDRPLEQGGGSTMTHPWEMWRYRHLESIGENIEIEFVDPSGSGEYHITRDPCEKDALSRVPGAGPSLSEILGRSSRAGRFSSANGTTCPMPLGGLSASMNEFESLDRYFRVQRPPEHFKDLAEVVTVRVVHNQIHIDYRADFLRVTSGTVLVPITVQVPNRDLSFQRKQGVHSAVLDLYGRITP